MDDRGDYQQAMLQAGQAWQAYQTTIQLQRLETVNQKLRDRIDRLTRRAWALAIALFVLKLLIAAYLLGWFALQ